MTIKNSFQEYLTYDDVLLIPQYSEVLPRETDLSTSLSRNIKLKIPFIAAAMDTVSEHKLAIALARQGGIAIIHKNMPIDRQVEEVRRVKRAESGMIIDPLTLSPDDSLASVNSIMKENKIGGIPIVGEQGKLLGIITNRDMRFETDFTKKVSDVMTKNNLITFPYSEKINLVQAETILQKEKIEKLPVVDADGVLRGLITYRDITLASNNPNACKDQHGRLRVGAAVGVTADVKERVKKLKEVGVDVIVIDSAHGDSKGIIETLKSIKSSFPKLDVIAGNIATVEAAKRLREAGADAVKVGIGPGTICTTRIVTGVGVPQFSAVYNIAKSLKEFGVPVIADGGIRYSGDVAKALGAGASSVMMGSVFAGCDEAPGETVLSEGRKFKTYRGMGSVEAMKDGSADRYFQDVEDGINTKFVPEGVVSMVPYSGTVKEQIHQFIGGLRASLGYCGSKNIHEFWKKAKFTKITSAGMKESHVHDVSMVKDAPNYSKS